MIMRCAWKPIPVDRWPDKDRKLWLEALYGGNLLGARGRAAHLSEPSRIKYRDGYARWLAFLSKMDPGALDESPADRVTVERLAEYLASIEHKAPYTRFGAVDELWAVLRIIAPKVDHPALRRAWKRLKKLAELTTAPDYNRIISGDRLVGAGIAYFGTAADIPFQLTGAIQARDGLMVAALALRPLRRRNFADLRIGRSLLETEYGWRIFFEPAETKTGRVIDFPWPEQLNAALTLYLNHYRPILLKGRTSDHLWITYRATPMTPHSITCRVKKITRDLVGVDISPHLFRDSLATTLAIEDPERVRAATVLLGHGTPRTTERYYNRAKTIEAGYEYQAMMRDRIRSKRRR